MDVEGMECLMMHRRPKQMVNPFKNYELCNILSIHKNQHLCYLLQILLYFMLDCLVPLTTVSRRGIPESCLSNKLNRLTLATFDDEGKLKHLIIDYITHLNFFT